MSTLITIILVGIIAILLHALLPSTLPHPFEAIPIQPLASERVARMHQALEFSKSPEWNHTEKRALQDNVEILFRDTVLGAESVAIRPTLHQIVMLDKFGYMHMADTTTTGKYLMKDDVPLPYLGPGRPLGFEFLNKDTLIVADSVKGLVQVNFLDTKQDTPPTQTDIDVSILTNTVNGSIVNYVNDIDIDHKHERIYFTSSGRGTVAFHSIEGHYDTMRSYLLNMYSGDVTGQLLMYNLRTRETSVIMDDLWYANGVTLSSKLDYVLVVETCGFRVVRKWLKGKKTGQQEDFITNLPGFPDGITRSSDGNYWISLVAPISPLLKFIESVRARYILSLLQFELDVTKHFLKQWGCVLKVSKDGEILDVLIDPDGSSVSTISAVTEHADGKLFLGNLGGNFVSVYDLSS